MSLRIWRVDRHGSLKSFLRTWSARFEDFEDGGGVLAPDIFLRREVPAAVGRQRVVARAPILFRQPPLGRDETGTLEAGQRFVQGSGFDLEDAVGALVDPTRDGVAEHRAPGECSEDQ